jgi:hypothetical protein
VGWFGESVRVVVLQEGLFETRGMCGRCEAWDVESAWCDVMVVVREHDVIG